MANDSYAPIQITIEEIAKQYIAEIKLLQPHGPYKFFGWCIGCDIIYEIINQLKDLGDTVDELYLAASSAPGLSDEKAIKDKDFEVNFISNFGISSDLINTLSNSSTIDEVWNILMSNIELLNNNKEQIKKVLELALPVDLTRATPNYHTTSLENILHTFNMIRSLVTAYSNYKPSNTFDVQAYYFNPLNDNNLGNQQINNDAWQKCFNNIKIIDLEGDHFSFFEKETDEKFIEELNKIMNKR